jgi:carboxymethylenebutenolidase
LLLLALCAGTGDQLSTAGQPRRLPVFLEEFRVGKEAPTLTKDVTFPSAVAPVAGYLARPDTPERLPGILLVPGQGGLDDWMKENARDLSGIGYVVLAVDPARAHQRTPGKDRARQEGLADEQTLAELSAAVRWLRRRPDVLPDRLGVVGWSRGGGQALALASAMRLEACITCDGPLAHEPALLAGLRGTPVLAIFGGKDEATQKALPAFRRALTEAHIPHRIGIYDKVGPGFMGPPDSKTYAQAAADRAYVEIYEFLGKHVEGALQDAPSLPPVAGQAVATIADLMRAVNEPTGVRGVLIQALEREPATPKQWDRVRANAALIAEACGLLQGRTPPKGTRRDWAEQTRAFREAAERIVAAGDRRDYAGARRGLGELASRCAACHAHHR